MTTTDTEDAESWMFIAQVSIRADMEETFNRLYDEEHVPALLSVPGVRSCNRYKLEWGDSEAMPTYLAIYVVDDPEVPHSEKWKAASNSGEWPHIVRPAMTIRQHGMFRKVG